MNDRCGPNPQLQARKNATMAPSTDIRGDRFRPFPNEDMRELHRFDDALALLLSRGITSVMHARSLLAVALAPAGGSADYAKRLGALQPVISRHLLELGPKARSGGPGLGYVDRDPDPTDMRNNRNYLTPAGRGLATQIISTLKQK